MKVKWEIVHDSDNEDGSPSLWGAEINHHKHGKFVWISGCTEGDYDVEVNPHGDYWRILVTCKTLTSAKRWVTINL